MKKLIIGIVLFWLIFINGYAAPASKTPEQKSLDEAITGAVNAIEGVLKGGTEIAFAEFEATPVKLASYLEKELRHKIDTNGKLAFQVRNEELTRLIDELNFQKSGYVSDDSFVGIGKMIGVKSMIFGSFDDLGSFYQYRVRVVNVKTSTVEVSYSARVRKNDQDIAGLLVNGGNTSNKSVKEEAIACYNRGIDNLAAGVEIPAMEEFNKAIKIDPKFAAAYIRRGVLYSRKYEKDKAKADFDSAVKLDENNFLAYFNRGAVQNDRQSEIADYTKAIEIDPDYLSAYIYRGYAYTRIKDYDHAIADFTAVLRFRPDDINVLYLRAKAYNSKSDYNRAITDFTSIIRIKPDDVTAYYLRGDMYYFDKKDYKNALTTYSSIIDIFPNDPNAFYIRGRVYEDLKDYNLAVSDWAAAAKLEPNYIHAYVRRGLVLLDNLRDYNNAISEFTKAIGIKPDSITQYARKSIPISIGAEDDQVALLTVSSVISSELNISPEYLFYFRGSAYQKKGDINKAFSDYSESLKIKPTFNVAYNRGKINIDREDFNVAIDDFNAALKVKPNDINSLVNRGYVYFMVGDYEKALDDYNTLLKINPKDIQTLLNRGITYINLGGRKYSLPQAESLARADWMEVLKIEPNNAQANEWLAVKYWW